MNRLRDAPVASSSSSSVAAVTGGGTKKQRSMPGEQDALTTMSSAVCSLEDVLQLLQLLYALSVDIRMENSDFGRFHYSLSFFGLCNVTGHSCRDFSDLPDSWFIFHTRRSYFTSEAPSKWLLGVALNRTSECNLVMR